VRALLIFAVSVSFKKFSRHFFHFWEALSPGFCFAVEVMKTTGSGTVLVPTCSEAAQLRGKTVPVSQVKRDMLSERRFDPYTQAHLFFRKGDEESELADEDCLSLGDDDSFFLVCADLNFESACTRLAFGKSAANVLKELFQFENHSLDKEELEKLKAVISSEAFKYFYDLEVVADDFSDVLDDTMVTRGVLRALSGCQDREIPEEEQRLLAFFLRSRTVEKELLKQSFQTPDDWWIRPPGVSDSVELFLNASACWKRVANDIRSAEVEVLIAGWDFNPLTKLDDRPNGLTVHQLLCKARDEHGVAVRLHFWSGM
jgi:hypothetical protein